MPHVDDIASRVLAFIERTATASDAERVAVADEFDEIARLAFALQYEHSAAYRRFCDRRGRTPDSVARWEDVPAVPTAAFKALDLACAPPEKIFITSGTTRGAEQRGRHLVPRLDLYRAAALAHFRHMVLPDGERLRVIGLLGGPKLLPSSSLVQMVEWIRLELAGGDGEYLVDERGFAPERAVDHIEAAARAGKPLCLIGLRTVFTALIDHLGRARRPLSLPAGSRIIDTGGSKGGRVLSDAGFLTACWQLLDVPGYLCINEYGMTELCSQFYDDVLRSRFDGSNAARRKLGPAWLRTRALDPTTLEPVPEGTPGILCHLDLANALSVLAVQTEDVGILSGSRIALRGRLPGAEPRGCALALADLLAAAP